MKRILFALPLAGVVMAATPVFAQSPSPAQESPSSGQEQPAQATGDERQPAATDCVDLSDAAPPSGTAAELPDALDAPADGDDEDNSGEVVSAPGESASETRPVAGPDAGTAPGGSGSSGWTGGLGGSDIGTSQAEELDSSPQEHPAVASGLDPISGETAVEGPQAPSEPEETAQARPDC